MTTGTKAQGTKAHPPIVSREQWVAERKKLLADEKEMTKHYDRVNAKRRRLPMVKIEKNYVFDGPANKPSLKDLFEGQRQLIVYHFMFDPAWEKGCPGCTGFVDALGDLSLLNKEDTTFAVISRAPLPKLEKYKAEKNWDINWFSSFGSDFNYDFHVTLDPKVAPLQYNYRTKEEMAASVGHPVKMEGESHGLSVFFRIGDEIFHTYSAYARGTESLTDAYRLLDVTPYGRQQEFEDSPSGWPQKPTYGWLSLAESFNCPDSYKSRVGTLRANMIAWRRRVLFVRKFSRHKCRPIACDSDARSIRLLCQSRRPAIFDHIANEADRYCADDHRAESDRKTEQMR